VKVILLGATGMVGQGVLRECLADPGVTAVVTIGRAATSHTDPKVMDRVVADLLAPASLAPHAADLADATTCFFCLGVSSAGMTEAAYTKVTYDLTLAIATQLARPTMTFIYVSGEGTNAKGRSMWARVKGRTEDALLALPFRAAYMFRPGFIQPLHGIVSKTRLYRVLYAITAPLYPLWRRLFPGLVTTTELVGQAMLRAARADAPAAGSRILATRAINALARAPRAS
jgi:uncharacterized protein YbjT (DUF2867 family)